MRFAHVSDLHLVAAESAAKVARPRAQFVAEAIAKDLAGIAESLDFVVVSGDLTDRAEPAAFMAFEDMFARIGLPLAVVPGNHDGPGEMRAYGASSEVFSNWDITNRVVEIGGVRFLGLDTCIQGAIEGAISHSGLELLEQEVARKTSSRLAVVMHHPPLVLGLAQFDSFCQLGERQRFLDIAANAEEQVIVISGHVHRPYFAQQGNIACFVAGSMAAPYDAALPFGDVPIRPMPLQDFYYVHHIDCAGRHVVTPQRVRALLEDSTTS
ncbi:MAG: metallophosphoesterase [Dinoroseobacter sp.]|nr:metallophosphoesterase [Dinoroseobacter sp.]